MKVSFLNNPEAMRQGHVLTGTHRGELGILKEKHSVIQGNTWFSWMWGIPAC